MLLKQPQLIALSLALLLGLAAVAPLAHAQTYSIFYTFPSNQDGNRAQGVIEDGAGNLYGAAYYGGAHSDGAIFEINPAGQETVLYSFKGTPDGNGPVGVVRDAHGNLYGATYFGGFNCLVQPGAGCGTLFKVDASGKETVLHAFGGRGDGVAPVGVVMDSKGSLYGTTSNGGDFSCDGKYTSGCGTIFKLDAAGRYSILHKFQGGVDGAGPGAVIVDAAGNLYGAAEGGTDSLGMVFKLTPSGGFSILHSFAGGPGDGCLPFSSLLLDAAGNLYGTTDQCGAFGYGTVFKLDATGNETTLYSFTGGSDGSFPYAGVVQDAAGNLYGTTGFGGDFDHDCTLSGDTPGCGVVFELSPTGQLTVLHAFQGTTDGLWPYWGVTLDAVGNLYGVTATGGASCGCGTVFKIIP